jgi:hypothetical protein
VPHDGLDRRRDAPAQRHHMVTRVLAGSSSREPRSSESDAWRELSPDAGAARPLPTPPAGPSERAWSCPSDCAQSALGGQPVAVGGNQGRRTDWSAGHAQKIHSAQPRVARPAGAGLALGVATSFARRGPWVRPSECDVTAPPTQAQTQGEPDPQKIHECRNFLALF